MMITLKCELLNIVEQTASSESEACSFRAQGNLNLYQAHDRNCVDCGSACVLSVPYFSDSFSPIFCSATPCKTVFQRLGFLHRFEQWEIPERDQMGGEKKVFFTIPFLLPGPWFRQFLCSYKDTAPFGKPPSMAVDLLVSVDTIPSP